MEWIKIFEQYDHCGGCYNFKLVSSKDHEKVAVNINLHIVGDEAAIRQMYATRGSPLGSFISHHVEFFDMLRDMKIKRITAKMIPKTAQNIKKHIHADVRLLETEFYAEFGGIELTSVEVNL